jgi:hypothetical protein
MTVQFNKLFIIILQNLSQTLRQNFKNPPQIIKTLTLTFRPAISLLSAQQHHTLSACLFSISIKKDEEEKNLFFHNNNLKIWANKSAAHNYLSPLSSAKLYSYYFYRSYAEIPKNIKRHNDERERVRKRFTLQLRNRITKQFF